MNAMDIALFNLGVRPDKTVGKMSRTRRTVLDVVRGAASPIQCPEIVRMTGINQATVYSHLDRLAAQGYVEKVVVHSHKFLWRAV